MQTENRLRFLPPALVLMCAGTVFAQPPVGRNYFLEHKLFGKCLSTTSQDNGAFIHLWEPSPDQDDRDYSFKLVNSGEQDYYHLIHNESGRYICTGGLKNGEPLHLWSPISPGHEDRFKFKLIKQDDGDYYLLHKHSQKYVTVGSRENGKRMHTFGPIPSGHEDNYKFRFASVETAAEPRHSPRKSEPAHPVAAAAAADQFAAGCVWVGITGDTNKTKGKFALSISSRTAQKFEGVVAVISSKGKKSEFPVTGTAPANGDGLVVFESPQMGRAKMFARGRLVNGHADLAFSTTNPLGQKTFGSASMAPSR